MSRGDPEWSEARAAAGLRLATGLLTVLPVGAVRPDRRTAAAAMLWAPLVGAALGTTAGTAAWVAAGAGVPPLVAGVLAVTVLAAATRGLHLDGLADTADALGSGRDPARGLTVMKAPDIGPFGVVTLVLVLLAQAGAVAGLLGPDHDHRAVAALALAGGASRVPLPWACRATVPAARSDGLGALVAGTVPGPAAVAWAAAAVSAAALTGWWADLGAGRAALAVALGLLAAGALLRRCRARFGGITGDVLGALVETAATVALVVLATA